MVVGGDVVVGRVVDGGGHGDLGVGLIGLHPVDEGVCQETKDVRW